MWAAGTVTGLLLAMAAPRAAVVVGCPTQTGMQDASRHTKPSSFEPHARPPGNAYGMPIGDQILTKRVKKKKPSGPAAKTNAPA
jgi:hypothetical protein